LNWQQGDVAPVSQSVDENCQMPAEALASQRVPERFEIYAQCACPTFLVAVGTTDPDGRWTQTELLGATNAIPYDHESDRQFKQRLAALDKHPGHCG
jgi:hypothetical protein